MTKPSKLTLSARIALGEFSIFRPEELVHALAQETTRWHNDSEYGDSLYAWLGFNQTEYEKLTTILGNMQTSQQLYASVVKP